MMAWLRARPVGLELRIDVPAEPPSLTDELDLLHQRLQRRAGALRACEPLGLLSEQWRVWHREADGEHYVYVEDLLHHCLAGYVVFNRLREVKRQLDPYVRSPHTKLAPHYRRRGIGSTLYAWALQQGYCLISSARQSPAAHALWQALGRHYPLGYVNLAQRQPVWLGSPVPRAVADALETRLMLLAPGHPAHLLAAPPAGRRANLQLRPWSHRPHHAPGSGSAGHGRAPATRRQPATSRLQS